MQPGQGRLHGLNYRFDWGKAPVIARYLSLDRLSSDEESPVGRAIVASFGSVIELELIHRLPVLAATPGDRD